MHGGSSPELRSIRAEYEHISSGFATKLADLREEGLAFNEEMAEREAKAKEEAEARRAEREAAQAEAAKKDGEKAPPPKPENPWAQPVRKPDAATRIGHFDEDDPPPLSNDYGPSSSPGPAPAAPRAPAVVKPVSPSRGKHAQPDDFDDDYEGNSWLRG